MATDTAPNTLKIPRESTMLSMLTELTGIKTALTSANNQASAMIGDLSNLTTGEKNSLVGAINWLVTYYNACRTDVDTIMNDIYAYLDLGSNSDNGAGLHNSLYRGKNLGSGPTADQLARVNDGTFKDLWLGDYWSKSITFTYLVPPKDSSGYAIQGDDTSTSITITPQMAIADHNYYRRAGDNIDLTQNHLDIIPLASLYSAPMNQKTSSGAFTTEGAYALSGMRTKYLSGATAAFNAFFGSAHVLTYRDLLPNATANGMASGHAWYDCKVELMDERQVYGCLVFDAAGKTAFGIPYRHTVSTKQFNLFRLRPDLISNRQAYWLRNVVSSAYFAHVYHGGLATYNYAANVFGVRPHALIY